MPLSILKPTQFSKFVYTTHTHTGKVRKHNEDACAIFETPNGLLCVVCDGMGGHLGGERASKLALEQIGKYMNSKQFALGTLEDALDQSFASAHAAIAYEAEKHPLLRGMGTTCVAILFHKDATFCAHVGDSRLYIFRNNELIRLTKDHSFVQGLIDEGIITEAEASYHPKRNLIERALGSDEAQPDIANLGRVLQDLRIGDVFLLCSDGLSNELNDVEIKHFLENETLALEEKIERMMEYALQAGGNDNITIQLIEKVE
ncbi:serine/threonine protein phosphatase [Bernardetia litoralis DSM 6794]|uniref:Serine/threonine protein phosphatase n=1 Tax=Bernardetia litoralis (strain ATCC 23117 / DSM 6794 / NBRC 15988 / NCIMB 1366 / Fx l1 / Sio-4) TaxID=880071 RepID=I4AQ19_BERLS|nr:Stp1/IreP family PP2C-type Ser/Thr phosphatase [Bernardetia litoralis]AFM06054.1 serine/threonine protein phosphatase [Bernardetia litoralis DSM 6794]